MKVKRFVAPNMRLALQMVREELGSEAIILSNKRVKEGVELLTAADEKESESFSNSPITSQSANPFQQHNVQSINSGAEPGIERHYVGASDQSPAKPSKLEMEVDRMQSQAQQRARELAGKMAQRGSPLPTDLYQSVSEPEIERSVYSEEPASVHTLPQISDELLPLNQNAPKQENHQQPEITTEKKSSVINAEHSFTKNNRRESDPEISQMRFELESMRELLEQQLSSISWGQMNDKEPHKASMWKRLKRMGLDANVADAMLKKIDDSGTAKEQWQQLMKLFCGSLTEDTDPIMTGGTFVFVGPTGAGKTTTIGKLATRYVLEHGADSVALISCDNYRIGAHDQLRTFGRILNVPVKIADKNNSLERVLFSLRHKKLILIDTAGLNPRDERLAKQLQTINELGGRAKTLMVMPATSQSQVLKSVYHHYKTDNLHGCILSKLDEAGSLGGVLSLVIKQQLSVAYCTNGQDIPNDLLLADRAELVRQCIDLAKHVVADNNVMVDEMTRLWKSQNQGA